MKRLALLAVIALSSLMIVLPACGDDEDDSTPAANNHDHNNDHNNASNNNTAANNNTANNNTANNHNNHNNTANNHSGHNNDTNNNTGGTNNNTGGTNNNTGGTNNNNPAPACLETGVSDCFSNYDCATGSICMDVAAEGEEPLPCCVPGTPGDGVKGDSCTLAEDCATSVCIEGDAAQQCSDICETDAECPASMYCFGVFGIDDMWCYPRRPCTEDFDCSNGDTCQAIDGGMLCGAP